MCLRCSGSFPHSEHLEEGIHAWRDRLTFFYAFLLIELSSLTNGNPPQNESLGAEVSPSGREFQPLCPSVDR